MTGLTDRVMALLAHREGIDIKELPGLIVGIAKALKVVEEMETGIAQEDVPQTSAVAPMESALASESVALSAPTLSAGPDTAVAAAVSPVAGASDVVVAAAPPEADAAPEPAPVPATAEEKKVARQAEIAAKVASAIAEREARKADRVKARHGREMAAVVATIEATNSGKPQKAKAAAAAAATGGPDGEAAAVEGTQFVFGLREPDDPAVPLSKSIHRRYLVCLEDGVKLQTLKRHLRARYNMTPEAYIAKWRLPADYPMVAPAYSELRSEVAKKQLGIKRGKRKAVSA
jgi:predicted transcriptional regulator